MIPKKLGTIEYFVFGIIALASIVAVVFVYLALTASVG